MAELIVALDVPSRAEAEARVKLLGDAVDFYKIGLELFTAEGPDVVKAVKGLGKKVFLDLKFHDIPNTAAQAVRSGGRLGVDLMTACKVAGIPYEDSFRYVGLLLLAMTIVLVLLIAFPALSTWLPSLIVAGA